MRRSGWLVAGGNRSNPRNTLIAIFCSLWFGTVRRFGEFFLDVTHTNARYEQADRRRRSQHVTSTEADLASGRTST